MTRLLQDLLTRQAAARPWAAAVIGHGQRLTYGELDAASNRLARLLRAGGCRAGERVALVAPKSPMAVVGLIGIYKADAIAVPLDIASTASRITRVLEASHCHWLLTAGCASLLQELSESRDGRRSLVIGSLDRTPTGNGHAAVFTIDDVVAYSAEPVDSRNDPDDPAQIMFTSGSSGHPDGVVLTHSNVLHFVDWAVRYFGMHANDRVAAHSPMHVDLSLFDIFGAAAAGAELHLLPPDCVSPPKLASFIRGRELTHWCSAPSVLSAMAGTDAIGPNDFPALQRVIWAGDTLPTPALQHWMQRVPHATFTNLYGQTEATIASSYYTVPACPSDPQQSIPIGSPCAGEELLVLDARMEPVAPGDVGDLYIAGAGLARGYWNDPDRTAAVFLHHPLRPSEWIYRTSDRAKVGPDGLVYVLGRNGTTVHADGHAMELGVIEAAVNTAPDIVESVVLSLSDGIEPATICCAYVAAPGSQTTPDAIGIIVSRLLPKHAVPARWLCLREFPVDANGRIDRIRLREAFVAGTAVPGSEFRVPGSLVPVPSSEF